MSFIIIFPKTSHQWSVVISVKIVSEQSKNYIKFHYQFWSTSVLKDSIFLLNLSSEHETADQYQGSDDRGELDINTVLNYLIQVKYVNPLMYRVSVSNFPSPEYGVLSILIGDLTLKISLLFFTLLSASKPNFENLPVSGNNIKSL